jgi:hypothetical protein
MKILPSEVAANHEVSDAGIVHAPTPQSSRWTGVSPNTWPNIESEQFFYVDFSKQRASTRPLARYGTSDVVLIINFG